MALNFDPSFPIRVPVELRVSHRPFFGPNEQKDPWVYEKLPESGIFSFSQEMTENMIVHLAGFVTPLFGWKTLVIQEAFPDALFEDVVTHTKIRVEFEKTSHDFFNHNHPASACDVILCWEDNLSQAERARLSAENPNLKIIELKRIFSHYEFALGHEQVI